MPRELGDEPPRDGRRQQGVAGGHYPERGKEVLGPGVLEDKAAGAPAGAMACHYLDGALIASAAVWLLDRLLLSTAPCGQGSRYYTSNSA